METTPLLRKKAKCPVDVTKKFVETRPANRYSRHYRKTPVEEHSHRNILNLITEQAYSPATSKLLCAVQSAVQFWSLLVSCHIITKQNKLQVSSFSQKVSYHRIATFVQ